MEFFLNFKKNEHCFEVFEQKRGQNATNMRFFKFHQKEMNGIFYFSWHEVTVAQILKSYWNCFWEGNSFWSFWPKVEFSSIKKFGMWNFSYLLHEVTVVKSFKIDLNNFFFLENNYWFQVFGPKGLKMAPTWGFLSFIDQKEIDRILWICWSMKKW